MIPPIASKFVAGESPAEALEHVRTLNDRGVAGILNLLGEHYDDPANATADTDAYLQLIDDIAESEIDACISVKPSQIGLDIGAETFEDNLTEIANRGAKRDVFVWVDMEDYTTTDNTLDAYEDLVRRHEGGMGLCLQANLKRTRDDLERLADVPGKVRIVKGAYDEPSEVAYTDKDRVDREYRKLIEYMFESFDDGVAIGSHDPEFVSVARDLHREHGTPYEIQMLMGVRTDAQYELAAEGVDVYQYIPYGNKWFSYFYRRVRERKENALFALRAIVN
ncbi:proline dehydrogenase family protein [Halobiforma nitratireducens]|uniref:proline dehydrogenase n=1 Tax=Halobiforma nitratireducens JCM 10879 TaxID=1227454 RepID=M0M2L3_9EURY|nr:proline dehydrogenase family protein [Halobiforma nitratireducens]EMA40032.1 proline dehydrogenase [Halobiforma nitratireducens JCM 10879]